MIELPTTPGGFRCLLADPAWHYTTRSETRQERRPQDHYDTMTVEEMCAMPVAASMADDAFAFIWTTGPHLRFTFDLIDAWGFTYSGLAFNWPKLARAMTPGKFDIIAEAVVHNHSFEPFDRLFHFGMGHGVRSCSEIALLARRGKPVRKSKSVREVIMANVREHSRKPSEQYDRIEEFCDGPYLELFGRHQRPGWAVWGNDSTLFSEA